jgi:predicted lipoprotein with Yx(FWY)xxD motif
MTRHITPLIAAMVTALAVVAVAGCGGGTHRAPASASPPKTANGRVATVGVASDGSLGRILVDSQGRTLYLFKRDSEAKSSCFGQCAVAWPPLRNAHTPLGGAGLAPANIGTMPRSDGTRQVTYKGHPLYLYQGDREPGDANGQGISAFGGRWFVLSPAGDQISVHGGSSGTGGSGY